VPPTPPRRNRPGPASEAKLHRPVRRPTAFLFFFRVLTAVQ
jgi:hypothetical protein